MSLYNGPPRPGARGGRGEFSWDNVKADKDREYYLGHSVKASVGRWQKGKDIFWYNKDKGDMGVSRDEIEAVKAAERQAMAEALGLKVKAPAPNKLRQQPSLEKHEVDKLLRGASGDQQAATAAAEGDRIAGLGFRSGAGVAVREAVHEVLQGTGLPGSSAAVTAAGGAGSAGPGGPALMSAEQLAALDKMDTPAAAAAAAAAAGKESKKNKKDKKDRKEKKKRRKEHKDKKRKSTEKSRRKQHSSSSRSDDSSSSSDVDSQDRHAHNRHQQSQLGRDRRQQQQIQQQMPVISEQALQQHHQHQERLDRRLVPERRDVGRSSQDKDHSRPSGGHLQQWSHAAVVEGSSRRNRRSPSPPHQYQQKQQRGRHDDEHRRHESSGRQRHGLDDTRNRSPVQQHPSSSSRRPRETCRSRSRSPVNGGGQYRSRR